MIMNRLHYITSKCVRISMKWSPTKLMGLIHISSWVTTINIDRQKLEVKGEAPFADRRYEKKAQ